MQILLQNNAFFIPDALYIKFILPINNNYHDKHYIFNYYNIFNPGKIAFPLFSQG